MKALVLSATFVFFSFLAPAALAVDADCGACGKVCDQTAKVIKKKGTNYAQLSKLMQDCSKICKLSDQMAGSEFEGRVAELCADVCKRCAEACEQQNDKDLQNCIAECRKCEKSCRSHKS